MFPNFYEKKKIIIICDLKLCPPGSQENHEEKFFTDNFPLSDVRRVNSNTHYM